MTEKEFLEAIEIIKNGKTYKVTGEEITIDDLNYLIEFYLNWKI